MKKLLSALLLLSVAGSNAVFAADKYILSEPADNANKTVSEVKETVQEPQRTIDVPKWEDYVPEKYQNPRGEFSKGHSIAELSVGIVLTDLLITAPIGIPMMVHGTTKLKNISYSKKKVKFENGLKEAENITDLDQREKYYKNLLASCDMTEKRKQKLAKKRAKKQK